MIDIKGYCDYIKNIILDLGPFSNTKPKFDN